MDGNVTYSDEMGKQEEEMLKRKREKTPTNKAKGRPFSAAAEFDEDEDRKILLAVLKIKTSLIDKYKFKNVAKQLTGEYN